MPDIDTLKQQYFVQAADAAPPARPVPDTYENCTVTPLIDGEAYFSDLQTELSALGGATADEEFIYIAGWIIDLLGYVGITPGSAGSGGSGTIGVGAPFKLDGHGGSTQLIDVLEQKAKDGVDVRVLGWVSWALMGSAIAQSGGVSIKNINIGTINSVDELRGETNLEKKCCLNTIGHSAGAAHTKMIVLGSESDSKAYTGGIDIHSSRWDTDEHVHTKWHDVQAKIEGPAVQSCYDLFRTMWDEVIGRDKITLDVDGIGDVTNYVSGTTPTPSRTLSTADAGDHHVQSLRTFPQFNYAWYNVWPEGDSLSFAPDGTFEIETAWKKTIESATEFVYIEDQSFWSEDVLQWLNTQIQSEPNLKVILIAGQADPLDPPLPPFRRRALSESLLPGLSAAQKERIGFFIRDVIVHSKTTIIDDQWALIGSANCSRRSLYSDIEHAVSILDENETLVPEYRTNLWGEHFGLSAGSRGPVSDLDKALHVWDSSWGSAGSGVSLPASVDRVDLDALSTGGLSDSNQDNYDNFYDLDSREDWGGCIP